MLKRHVAVAREGLRGFQVVRNDYAKREGEAPPGRIMRSRVEFLARTEPLMELIAAGQLPQDDATTAYIVQQHMKEEEKLLESLLGESES